MTTVAHTVVGKGTTATSSLVSDTQTITLAPTSTTRTPTTTAATCPPWLREELDAFFRDRLAAAIQARESELVNVMHDCVQQELREKDRYIQHERQRATELNAQAQDHEKTVEHLQSKLDRRIDENNALRKDFYKQLLMLRELVAKHRSDPRTMKALDDVIASVTTGKQPESSSTAGGKAATWAEKAKASTKVLEETRSSSTPNGSIGMRREKEKWEQRAREAVAECQQLQEQLLLCKQQREEARRMDGELWFASSQHGLYERQRIIDCVYKSKCSWENVGESIVELLNNEMIWEAVEGSAYREKTRVSRGLEALLLRAESTRGEVVDGGLAALADEEGLEAVVDSHDGAKRTITRRRSAFSQASRLIMCRSCNGCGYLDAAEAVSAPQAGGARQENEEPEDDSYLRKTLAQVLELKASLEEANARTIQVEQQLLHTVTEGSQIKQKLEKIEYTRAHSVDSCLQTDLDEEEKISLDDIMKAHNNGDDDGSDAECGLMAKKRGSRWKQYEHLIVELKSLLSERDAGIAKMKSTVSDAQARLITVQRTSQQEQERLQRELQTLKGSLALAMSSRDEVIEEKQAAVKLLLKNIDRKKTQAVVPPVNFLATKFNDDAKSAAGGDEADEDDDDDVDEDVGKLDDQDDVKRAERIARRYSDAISRVQQEYEEQQQRLKDAEDELGSESDKRKRTNSISMGNIVVTMSSHPRDIFKALSNTHQDLLTLRRSSQRASALQTDRLLTLTTHLAHISEELAMVKKRTCAEIDFWKLDCEKLQNANKALAADLQAAHKNLEEANERVREARASASTVKVCGLCEKHEARLLEISQQLLVERKGSVVSNTALQDKSGAAASLELTESECSGLCSILLDLENMYATLNSSKQQQAKAAITKALLGTDASRSRTPMSITPTGASADSAIANVGASHSGDSVGGGSKSMPSRLFSISLPTRDIMGRSSPPGSILDSYDSPSNQQDGLLLHGTAIDTDRHSGHDPSPSHRKKTVVRKVLTERQVAQRQLAQRQRQHRRADRDEMSSGTLQLGLDQVLEPLEPELDEDMVDDDFFSYIDENGTEVFYVDIAVDEPQPEYPGSIPSQDHVLHNQLHVEKTLPRDISYRGLNDQPRRPEYAIQIPSAMTPELTGMARSPKLLQPSSEIDKDPEVITKLKELVAHTSTARERLALANWKILVCHLRASHEQQRLDYVNDQFRDHIASSRSKTGSWNGSVPSRPLVLRTTMQKLVQFRELVLDSAVRYRDSLRKESRRAQAHLIHGVSSVLTTLSRKNRPLPTTSDAMQYAHLDPDVVNRQHQSSPSHSPHRPLYPSVKVNLSDIPETQQIPTPTFPFTQLQSASSPSATPPHAPRARSPNLVDDSIVARLSTRTPDYLDAPPPSIFEADNRFPQRVVRFIPAGDGNDMSLTHATSSIRFPSTSPSASPTKSPSKVGLALDLRRRPTHSAGPIRSPRSAYVEDAVVTGPQYPIPAVNPELAFAYRPTRPQSSPASSSSRVRSAYVAASSESSATGSSKVTDTIPPTIVPRF